jgi:hypothetical protein
MWFYLFTDKPATACHATSEANGVVYALSCIFLFLTKIENKDHFMF